jgi:GT2 family glycosyltransferase
VTQTACSPFRPSLTVQEQPPELSSSETSVVIATHSLDRFVMLNRAIDSVMALRPAPGEVIIAVDHNPELATKLTSVRNDIRVIEHTGSSGASGTRNAGAAHARGRILVFTDDDVTVRQDWLIELTGPFDDPLVVGTGGRTLPAWQGVRPRWFPDEFAWVVGASHAGLPESQANVRNVWSENMAIRREAFARVQGFRQDFGKVGRVSRPEDTDLCIRVSDALPSTCWVYVPSAIVDHVVPEDRGTLAFFLRRCYWEGAGKVELSAHLNGYQDLGDERAYLGRTLPLALVREVRQGRFPRAAALIAGVCAAGVGGVRALARFRLRR